MSASPSAKWKSNFVSSGIPLEFEVAKLLVGRKFSVSADYPYHRADDGRLKQFSVDINADYFAPLVGDAPTSARLHVLLECKARHPGVSWLFFPDPNEPDFSPHSWGSPLRAVDALSKWFLHELPYDFDALLPEAYKGVEIDLNSSKVHDSEVRHGLMQLQYALPALLQDCILSGALGHPDDNAPFFYAPVLVTDAPLLLARKSLTRRRIEAATLPTDLGTEVPYLVVYVEPGPEFEEHSGRQLKDLPRLSQERAIQAAEVRRKEVGTYEYDLPSTILGSLARGSGMIRLRKQFTHLVVCNAAHLGGLMAAMKRSVIRCNRAISGEPPEKRSPRRRNAAR